MPTGKQPFRPILFKIKSTSIFSCVEKAGGKKNCSFKTKMKRKCSLFSLLQNRLSCNERESARDRKIYNNCKFDFTLSLVVVEWESGWASGFYRGTIVRKASARRRERKR